MADATTTTAPAKTAPVAPAPAPVADVAKATPPAPEPAPAPAIVEPVASVPAVPAVKMIEVLLKRKYQPVYEYTIDHAAMNAEAVYTDKGELVKQSDIPYDQALDKFGQRYTVDRQTFTPVPAGYTIKLPETEAKRALKLDIAQITENSFG